MSIPSLCHVMLHTVFARLSSVDFKTRCKIPFLENASWTFDEIQSVSAPGNDPNCSYYVLDYKSMHEMGYQRSIGLVQNLTVKPATEECFDYVHEGSDIYTIYQEFSLICQRNILAEVLYISPVYGMIIGSVFLAPVADILGRKRVLEWGKTIFMTAGLLLCLASHIQTVILGRVLAGIAFATMWHCIEAVVVEISNTRLRPLRFIATNIGIGLGYITIPLFATKINHWRHLQWTISCPLLILPLAVWYIPESPRWVRCKHQPARAWAILKTMKDPVIQAELLTAYRNQKIDYREMVIQHVKQFYPFFVSKLWYLVLLSFITGSVYFKNFVGNFKLKFRTSRPTYFILSGIAETFAYMFCMLSILIFGRRTTLVLCFISGGMLYFIASQLEIGSIEILICLLMVEIATSSAFAASLLYMSEIVPTSHRCTSLGVAIGFGGGMSTVIIYHIAHRFGTNGNVFILLGFQCLLGAAVSCFAHEPKRDNVCDTIEEISRPHVN